MAQPSRRYDVNIANYAVGSKKHFTITLLKSLLSHFLFVSVKSFGYLTCNARSQTVGA